MSWLAAVDGGVRLQLHIQPRASKTEIAGVHGDALKIRLAAPPVDGAANEALVRFLAERLGVAGASVTLVAGLASRRKTVRVDAITVAAVRQLLAVTAS